MELYYVERKCYYKSEAGIDLQEADGGHLPHLYHTKEKAILRAIKTARTLCNMFGYTVSIAQDNHPAVQGDCVYAETLTKANVREELRVYKLYTQS